MSFSLCFKLFIGFYGLTTSICMCLHTHKYACPCNTMYVYNFCVFVFVFVQTVSVCQKLCHQTYYGCRHFKMCHLYTNKWEIVSLSLFVCIACIVYVCVMGLCIFNNKTRYELVTDTVCIMTVCCVFCDIHHQLDSHQIQSTFLCFCQVHTGLKHDA